MRPSLGLVLYRRGRGRASRTNNTRKKPRKKHHVIMPHSPL